MLRGLPPSIHVPQAWADRSIPTMLDAAGGAPERERSMRLNTKIGLILVVPMVIAAGALAWMLRSEVMTRFLALERAELLQHHDRLLHAIDAEFKALSRLSVDWGVYDETYSFVAGENPGFVESTMTASTFENLEIDGVLVLGADSQVLGAWGYDRQQKRVTELPPDLVHEIAALQGSGAGPRSRGILASQGRVLQLASSEITDSNAELPSRGRLLMMRYLDQGEVDQLAQRIRLGLRFTALRGEARSEVPGRNRCIFASTDPTASRPSRPWTTCTAPLPCSCRCPCRGTSITRAVMRWAICSASPSPYWCCSCWAPSSPFAGSR